MRVIMVMFDSLNRHMLPPYGCNWVHAPNFARLAQRAVTFERSYVCSMPCMPARRELHTGRPNFLHRSWGPIEPFDDSVMQILKDQGVSTHLVSDHLHYWEDGGSTYHNRYRTWEAIRGQQGDRWIGQLEDPPQPAKILGQGGREHPLVRQDWVNRQHMPQEHLQPQSRTFAAGLDFIERNYQSDGWMLQIETFDPHEPFFSARYYQDLYPEEYDGAHFDYPAYRAVTESPEEVAHCRRQYAALVSMCDKNLGDVLDAMDRHGMWDDTMLVVWTDHGFLLGEHGSWAKVWVPWYEEVAHTPFFVWDPRHRCAGQRRSALVQPAIDLAPTLLEFFGLQPTPYMLGHSLQPVIERDHPVRQAALFGQHGGHVNVTDGRWVYMRAAADEANAPLFNYTLMPTHMFRRFSIEELHAMEMTDPFPFTKGCRVLKVPHEANLVSRSLAAGTLLFDLERDPQQQHPVRDQAAERRMIELMTNLMRQCEAPPEQYVRLGLDDRM